MKYNRLALVITLLITRLCMGVDGSERLEPLNNPPSKKAVVGGLALLATGYVNGGALDWSVTSNYSISPDSTMVALNYLVQNLSVVGDANGMVSFTVEGGSNQGVFSATDTGSFTSQIFDNYTTFTGSVIGADGGNTTFSLYGSYLGDPIEGTASAISSGTISGPVAFDDITVSYVAYRSVNVCTFKEIALSTSNFLSSITLSIETTPFYPAHPNNIFRFATTTNLLSSSWTTNSTLHSITGAVTSVTITNNTSSAFYKIINE